MQAISLLVFGVCLSLNVLGVSVDACLMWAGVTTLSEFARRNGWFAAAIIAVNAIGTVAITIHLSNYQGSQQCK